MPTLEQLQNPTGLAGRQKMDNRAPWQRVTQSQPSIPDPMPPKEPAYTQTVPGATQVAPYDYSSILKGQADQYKDFTSNRQNLSDQQFNPYAQKARRDLAGSIKKVRDDYNSRGLLSSGARKGAEIGARNAANEDLAQKRVSINQGLLDTQRGMEAGMFNTASAMAAPGMDTTNAYLNRLKVDLANKIEDDELANQMWQNIIGGITSAGGYGLSQLK